MPPATDSRSPAQSPLRILLVIACAIFVAEAVVMLVLSFLPPLPVAAEAAVDALSLVVLIAPTLYFFLFRPLVEHVRERARMEESLRKNEEEQFKLMVRTSLDGFWITDVRGRFIEVNDAYCRMTGYSREELLGLSLADVVVTEGPGGISQRLENIIRKGNGHFETRHRRRDGRLLTIEASVNYSDTDGGKFYCFFRDITARKAAEEELRLAEMVYWNSSEAIIVTDKDNQIVSTNPAFTRITGYELDEVLGKKPNVLKSGRHSEEFYQEMWRSINATGHWHGEIWDRRKSGEIYAKLLSINAIRNLDGTLHRYMAMFSDITAKKQTEELIWHQANYDAVTNLPNRRLFRDRLEQELKKAHRTNLKLALMFIDLDRFKEVNDTLGHDIGDALLVEAAQRISSCVRESDTVARLGGDEFTVILSEIHDVSNVERIAECIIRKMAEPFLLGNEVVYVSASMGITLYPDDATETEELLKNADQAMYVAKSQGRNRFSHFTPTMQEASIGRLRLINDLRGALAAGQFEAYYQPIVDLETGRIHKAEALIRWRHPERGMVSPAEFIPLAEETGVIVGIGDWIFRESLRTVSRLRAVHDPEFQISVNKSPVQFRSKDDLTKTWLPYLRELGLDGQSVIIEITEGLLLDEGGDVAGKLDDFREAGIHVSIDDFGTGYSSLSYLKKFHVNYLKIDKSFVRDMATDPNDLALSEAIIVMAHKLGIKVIAEGVETAEQRDMLAAAGCDYAQGYLFARPMPAAELDSFLAAYKAANSRDGIA